MTTADPLSIRRLYGRAQGHPLRANAQHLVDTLLPRLEVPADGALSAERLFGDQRPLAFEVGFGKGEHLAFQAGRRPDWGFIGAAKPGYLANTLTPSVGDGNTNTPEFKTFLVKVEKA